jgi:hypothetical protein
MGLDMRDLYPRPSDGVSIRMLSRLRGLPETFLREQGLEDSDDDPAYPPSVVFRYVDESGWTKAHRRRNSIGKPAKGRSKFLWRTGDTPLPYGLGHMKSIREQGWVLFVEGETDALTGWFNGLPVIGIPGADMWKPEWAAYFDGLEGYVWKEPGQGGETFVSKLAASFPDIRVIQAPDGIKDLSEAHTSGDLTLTWMERLKQTAKPYTGEDDGYQETKKPFTVYSIAEYRNRSVPGYVVDGVLQEASLAMIYGGFATFKSFGALDMGLSVASGRPWYGHRTRQGPVLFIIGEGGGHFLKRVDAWLSFHDLPDVPDFLMLPDAPLLNSEQDLKAFIDVVKALPVMPAVVIVDTVARTYAGNENATEDMGKYVAAAAAIQKLGPAVVLIHHTGKDGRYRGNSALPGALDTIIRFDRKNGRVKVKNEKQKDDNEFPTFTLKKNVVALGKFVDLETDVIDLNVATSLVFTRDDSPSTDSDDLTDTQRQVLAVLSDANDEGLTFTEWLKAFGGPKSTFSDAKDVLVEGGYVGAPAKGGKGARYTLTPKGRDALDSPDVEGETDDAA